jgi:hypothetical protein
MLLALLFRFEALFFRFATLLFRLPLHQVMHTDELRRCV